MSATRQRLVIYGAQGKIRGIIENRVLRNCNWRCKDGTHTGHDDA